MANPHKGVPARVVTPLYKLRKDRHWSQERLAGISGVTNTWVRKIESGDLNKVLNINLRNLCKLAIALECAPADICPFLNKSPRAEHGRRTPASERQARDRIDAMDERDPNVNVDRMFTGHRQTKR